jgi:SpoVK/Ycf46/Vps4 family AAA+-type ATPase
MADGKTVKMARADLLVTLVDAATSGDNSLVRKTVQAMAAEERAKKHIVLAEQLEGKLRGNANSPKAEIVPFRTMNQPDVVTELIPRKSLSDVVISLPIRRAVDELIQEHHRADLLQSYNLRPRNRILLTGAPGNGKTSLAEAIASALMVPFVLARYDALITSFLGETATRLRRLFDYAHSRRCVLFFDEFDTLGKERGDIHETGEIKRVVSSLLLQIDDLPSHVVVICATNHPELLDRAVWRRFQLRMDLAPPGKTQIEEFISLVANRMNLSLRPQMPLLVQSLTGSSFSEIEDFLTDVARSYVLSLPGSDVRSIISDKLRQRNSFSATPAKRVPSKGRRQAK